MPRISLGSIGWILLIRQEVRGIFAEPTLRMAVRHLLEEGAATASPDGGVR
jgi:hypothetical protein